MARRDERAWRDYASDEQRRQAGCIGSQNGAVILRRALRPRRSDSKGALALAAESNRHIT